MVKAEFMLMTGHVVQSRALSANRLTWPRTISLAGLVSSGQTSSVKTMIFTTNLWRRATGQGHVRSNWPHVNDDNDEKS